MSPDDEDFEDHLSEFRRRFKESEPAEDTEESSEAGDAASDPETIGDADRPGEEADEASEEKQDAKPEATRGVDRDEDGVAEDDARQPEDNKGTSDREPSTDEDPPPPSFKGSFVLPEDTEEDEEDRAFPAPPRNEGEPDEEWEDSADESVHRRTSSSTAESTPADPPKPVTVLLRRLRLAPWTWAVLGCLGLILLCGAAVSFGVWTGYRVVEGRLLAPSPDAVEMARDILHYEMPGGGRELATVSLLYTMSTVQNRDEPPTALLAVASFPPAWTGNPPQTFTDRFDRQFDRGRLTFHTDETETTELCGTRVTYHRRIGTLTRRDSETSALLYRGCFARNAGTVCFLCLGMGSEAEQRATELFESLECP